jgi:hypothetical protein
MQMIFQDPFVSLNPRMRVGDIVGEPVASAASAGACLYAGVACGGAGIPGEVRFESR